MPLTELQQRTSKLQDWRGREACEAEARGEEMFIGVPDAWYEPATWCCANGHVSSRYLKSEVNGCTCLACGEPVYLCPLITELELKKILA